MLKDEIRARFKQAMKARDTVSKEILRVAIGEIDVAETRANAALDDAAVEKILRKLVKSKKGRAHIDKNIMCLFVTFGVPINAEMNTSCSMPFLRKLPIMVITDGSRSFIYILLFLQAILDSIWQNYYKVL